MKHRPIINIHTHIFTDKDIPNLIGRRFVPQPFHLLTWLPALIFIFRQWKKLSFRLDQAYKPVHKAKSYIHTSYIMSTLFYALYALLIANSIYFCLEYFNISMPEDSYITIAFQKIFDVLNAEEFFFPRAQGILTFIVVGLPLLLPKVTWKIIWFLLKLIVKPLSMLPSKKTIEFLKRYTLIMEFAKYKDQGDIFSKLYKMYPQDSKFVVLPMDMEYMKAGKVRRPYLEQLEEINGLLNRKTNKNYQNLISFLFVDPRRIEENKKDPTTNLVFFDYEFVNGKVVLKDCLFKKYFEEDPNDKTSGKFKGIKMYPALGYYPFDESLLPLWLYCTQRNIPITTHCSVGTIFYRGKMKPAWFEHPVFKSKKGKKLQTHEQRNIELQVNWTHPLNYIVLLEEYYLKRWLQDCSSATQELFGFKSIDQDLDRNLSTLKINLAHYGNTEEWKKHLERDRNEETQEINEMPNLGISFLYSQNEISNPNREVNPNKIISLWEKKEDWYSLISSMMVQYENVYADISYTLHDADIKALLIHTLHNPNLAPKVLFGSDFYVVRNHKSEKLMYSELLSELSEEDFRKITWDNPVRFLAMD